MDNMSIDIIMPTPAFVKDAWARDFSFIQFIFSQGITLPVPPVIESLESKMPPRILKYPPMMDFLKVSPFSLELFQNTLKYVLRNYDLLRM